MTIWWADANGQLGEQQIEHGRRRIVGPYALAQKQRQAMGEIYKNLLTGPRDPYEYMGKNRIK